MEEQQVGQAITTYKLHLYKKHLNWLKDTKKLYNQVLEFYYQILFKQEELFMHSNHRLLRELEIQTVGTREMKEKGENPKYSLEKFPTLPLYFRRAAINNAISLMRSYLRHRKNWEEGREGETPPSPTQNFDASPIYYKGMYREFQKTSIQLKLFNGSRWIWVKYRFVGREFPDKSRTLSPTIKVEGREAWLHVPVIQQVSDIRTVRERMDKTERIAAVYLPGSDTMAVCVVMTQKGEALNSYFVHGGQELQTKRQIICKKAEKSLKSRHPNCDWKGNTWENRALYKRIEQLNNHFAHVVSRRIVDYCAEQRVAVIVVPNYEQEIKFQNKRFMKTNEYSWIGRKIIRFLKYKAFQNGMMVSGIPPYHITDICSQCESPIQRYNEGHTPSRNYWGGQLFRCPNGHKGNVALNAAKNIGLHFLKYYNLDEL